MPSRKNPKNERPLEVKPTEPRPPVPKRRESRLLAGPNAAATRKKVEEALQPQEAPDERALLRLNDEARAIARRIVRDPAAQDLAFRREAVSALGVFRDPESVMLLAELLDGHEEDPVLVGRAADAVAKIGGGAGARLIARALDHPDPYARGRVARALCDLGHPDSIEPLAEIAATDPSEYLRDRASAVLTEMGVEPPKTRYRRRRPTARRNRIAREG